MFRSLTFLTILERHSQRMSLHQRGALIVFEGCDRSGKTTQCHKLVNHLNEDGIKTEFCRFPERDTTIGKMIGSYLEQKEELEDHVVHLLFTANRWEAKSKMLEQLAEGTNLIVDRYSFSGVAFSSAKQGMDFDWCKQPEVGLPEPDAVVYLTLSAEEAAKRGAYGGERYEKMEFQKAVAENYGKLKAPNWIEIDADKSVDDLHEELKKVVKEIISRERTSPVGKLWSKNKSDSNGESILNSANNGEKQVLLNGQYNGIQDSDSTAPKKPRIDVNSGDAQTNQYFRN